MPTPEGYTTLDDTIQQFFVDAGRYASVAAWRNHARYLNRQDRQRSYGKRRRTGRRRL